MADFSYGQFFQADSSPGSSSGDVRLSNATTSSSLEMRMTVKQIAKDALVRCINYPEGKRVCASESSDLPVAELDSAVRDGLDIGGNRFVLYWTGMLIQIS